VQSRERQGLAFMKSAGAIAAGWMLVTITSSAVFAGATVTNVETAGSLKPTHDLECIPLAGIKTEYTPADLMVALGKCTRAGRYDDAMVLMLVAGTYARFDTLRVADISAHAAFEVIQSRNPLDERARTALRAISEKYAAPNSPDMATLCRHLKQLGPPNYYPAYMVRHGMSAMFRSFGGVNGNDGLVPDFDVPKAWKQSLSSWLHCDVSDMTP
jgi:hypothetical protein